MAISRASGEICGGTHGKKGNLKERRNHGLNKRLGRLEEPSKRMSKREIGGMAEIEDIAIEIVARDGKS